MYRDYLAALWNDWVARMSGLASIVLAFLAAYLEFVVKNGKAALWVTAAVCFIVASYRIWAKERKALTAERARNGLPEITGDIYMVDVDATLLDHFLTIELRLTSKREATTISGFRLTLTYKGKFYEAERAPVKEYYVDREILHPAPFETKSETQSFALEDLAKENGTLFVKGAHRTGWLRFLIRTDGSEFDTRFFTAKDGIQFLREGVELVLTVYDGYGTPHPIHYVSSGKPQPVRIRRIQTPTRWR